MNKGRGKPGKFFELRRLAEDSLRGRPADDRLPSELSTEEMRGLIHELWVYQRELEMQNEELRRAQLELEATRDKYTDLYGFAPVGYLTLDQQLLIVEANFTCGVFSLCCQGLSE
jgi:hypothetical protein